MSLKIVDIRKEVFYDEEGVEGFIWELENGEEHFELGDHNEPPVLPETLCERFFK